MEELFYEIVNEASNSKIIIDGDEYCIPFNTIIYNDNKIIFNNIKENNFPTLIIKDKKIFFQKLKKYLELEILVNRKTNSFLKNIERNKLKQIISYLFVNATTQDFENPIQLIDKYISFLTDNTFSDLNNLKSISMNGLFLDSNIEIKNTIQSVSMETPNKIDLALTKVINGEKFSYDIPSISYGIYNNTCYIYSIINPKLENNNLEYNKKIKRELYKINSGVSSNESDEYLKYKNNEIDYYPENISDVSPSAVLSLSIFMSLLYSKHITNIKVVPYLPIRYLSREIMANSLSNTDKKQELNNRNNFIQSNITDKFIRTFRRISYHLSGTQIKSYPYELDEYMNINLNDISLKDDIVNQVYNIINNEINLKNKKF